jgi:hypothetical protein
MNFWAQIFDLIGAICVIISVQMKHKKHILLLLAIGEVCFAIGFILLKAYTGAVICSVSTFEVITTYIFYSGKKKIPLLLRFIFILLQLVGGVLSYQEIFDILPIICAVLYTLSITSRKERNMRSISTINSILWIVYDLIVGSYTGVLSDVTCVLSGVTAMIRYRPKYRKR